MPWPFMAAPGLPATLISFVSRSPENTARIAQAISDFSSGSIQIQALDLQRPDKMLRLGNEPNRVDILTSISGVEFNDAWPRRIAAELGGTPVFFIHYDDLIKNKLATGRLKDAADADELRRE